MEYLGVYFVLFLESLPVSYVSALGLYRIKAKIVEGAQGFYLNVQFERTAVKGACVEGWQVFRVNSPNYLARG